MKPRFNLFFVKENIAAIRQTTRMATRYIVVKQLQFTIKKLKMLNSISEHGIKNKLCNVQQKFQIQRTRKIRLNKHETNVIYQ